MLEISKKVNGLNSISFLSATVLAFTLVPSTVFAGLIITNTPGYTMVDFVAPTGISASSATSLNGDVVEFTKKNGSPSTSMLVGDKTSQPWWDGVDNDFYYTNVADQNWVELILPEYTVGFSLSIDASWSTSAWIMGVADDGSAVDTQGNQFTMTSSGSFQPTPAWNIPLSANGLAGAAEFYADNSGSSCNTIQKVVIEPKYWGMGDFNIAIDENACGGKVPEPSILALMGIGLAGLGMVRRRKCQVQA